MREIEIMLFGRWFSIEFHTNGAIAQVFEIREDPEHAKPEHDYVPLDQLGLTDFEKAAIYHVAELAKDEKANDD